MQSLGYMLAYLLNPQRLPWLEFTENGKRINPLDLALLKESTTPANLFYPASVEFVNYM